MCRICERDSDLTAQYWAGRVGEATYLKALTGSVTATAFPDGIGDVKLFPSIGLIVTPDEAGNGIGVAPGNPVITVDAAPGVATLNMIADEDFFQVVLEAGKLYEIGQYALVGGPNGIPLADAYIELYDSAGNLIVSADGGGPNTPSGLDALLTYQATATGTYYVNFRAYDEVPEDGTRGDAVGDYTYFVNEVDPNDPNVYRPYYDVDSPLYALDWGTQVNRVNQSVRNPDGDEGTRDTGNAQGTPTYGSAVDVAALAAAQGKDITGKNVITIYFAKAGDVFTSIEDPSNPGLPPVLVSVGTEEWEKQTVWTALGEFEKVADIVYIEVDNRDDADFFFTTYAGTPGPGVSLLGSMSPPDYPDEGLAQFNSGDYRWNEQDLQQGGFSFVTLIHEFGHGHGLAHPHDGGGRSGVMNGVESEGVAFDYTTGDYDLNQGVFTMMSYEDGWQTSPYGNAPTDAGYGYLGGLMAFDIAVIQDKYGVNEEWATGNDTYVLKDENAAGTYYYSIWDAGGTDKIVYSGARDTTIDLRPATLQYEPGGGGRVSFAFGVYGGFTIANGVTIENAYSGSGNDTLVGNAANNWLDGGDGNDYLDLAGGGSDIGVGGNGNDAFYFGAGLSAGDQAVGGAGTDQLAVQGNYHNFYLTGLMFDGIESMVLLSSQDNRFGGGSGDPSVLFSYNFRTMDSMVAAGATMSISATGLLAGENVHFNGSGETDGKFLIFAGHGNDTLIGGWGNDAFFFGPNGRFTGADSVNGGLGTDQLGLKGDYSSQVVFGASTLANVEAIVVFSASDLRYGGGSDPVGYNLKTHDGNVAAGALLSVTGSGLEAGESLVFDGSSETDGMFRLIGGKGEDTLTGGAQADHLFGGLAADDLAGGGGDDWFIYRAAAESTTGAVDQILDFTAGDKIDLAYIDADSTAEGSQAFTFIGSGAFTGAGQLRAVDQGSGQWLIEGDIDGDGTADLVIGVTTTGGHLIGASDFFL